jgi:uncharacterized protein
MLERVGNQRSMNLEQLDGFLVALVCCPDSVPPSEYLPEILGGNIALEDTFKEQPILEDFISLVFRHWNTIVGTLRSGDAHLPLLLDDENGVAHANDWATGFVRGMELRKGEWADLLDDEEHGGCLIPILALAHEHDPDPAMRSYSEPISLELREKLIVGAAAGVRRIYRYFEEQHLPDAPEFGLTTTFRRTMPKIGRNDPCPCGSGKKFKHCCAMRTLH